jgi:hypothetical protein
VESNLHRERLIHVFPAAGPLQGSKEIRIGISTTMHFTACSSALNIQEATKIDYYLLVTAFQFVETSATEPRH